jgi:ADP-ribose pyrophosphatase YjhB (NUDIX family)
MARRLRGGAASPMLGPMSWRRNVEPLLRPLIFAWFKLARGLTLGVRGIVTDGEGRVLLVEHSYVHGWHLPGGGVERGEMAAESLARELVEEAGVRLTGPARLLSIHSNHAHHPGDHVLVYRCEAWEPCPATSRGEIEQVGWFAPDALPEGTKPGHRRRIEEALAGREVGHDW